jgi:prepilin signal peptidase PulO-like enzyme (type II secretory pathway)
MTCFTALSLYDGRWFILPDRIVWPVTLLAGYFVIGRILQMEDTTLLLWAGLGAATLSGVFWLLSLLSKGTWIGWGDVKLALSLGLLIASPLNALLVIFIASITGTLIALPGMVLRRKGLGSQLPFGPHLMLATVIVFLFGGSIIQWYTGLFAS